MYEINESVYQRFEQKNNMILRRLWDKSLPTFGKMFEYNIKKHINSHTEGYSRVDFAFVAAGWTVYEKFPYAFSWERKDLMDLSRQMTLFFNPSIKHQIMGLGTGVSILAQYA